MKFVQTSKSKMHFLRSVQRACNYKIFSTQSLTQIGLSLKKNATGPNRNVQLRNVQDNPSWSG